MGPGRTAKLTAPAGSEGLPEGSAALAGVHGRPVHQVRSALIRAEEQNLLFLRTYEMDRSTRGE